MSGGLIKKTEHALVKETGRLITLSVYFVEGTVYLVFTLVQYWWVFLLLPVMSIALYGMREVLRGSFHVLEPIVSFILSAVDTVVNDIIGGVDELAKIVRTISFGSVHFHVDTIDITGKASVVTDALNAFKTCDAVDTIDWEVLFAVKKHTHNLCSVVRYTYPVDFMYDTLNWLFGWAIYDPNPTHGTGCEEPPFFTFCFVMNFYLWIKLIVILMFAYLFVRAYWKTFRYAMTYFVLPIVFFALHELHKFLVFISTSRRHAPVMYP